MFRMPFETKCRSEKCDWSVVAFYFRYVLERMEAWVVTLLFVVEA